MFWKPRWLDFLGIASDTISSKLPIPLTLTVFWSSLLQWFLSLGCKKECVVDVSVETRLCSPVLWLVVGFCDSLHWLQREVSWWGVRTTFICEWKDTYLDCSSGLCWFSKMVIVGSSPRCMTSLTLDSYLGFQYQTWFPSYWTGLTSFYRAVGYHKGMCAPTGLQMPSWSLLWSIGIMCG